MTAVLAELPGIGLADVVAASDLQTRRDRKYLLPEGALDDLLADLRARVLTIDGLRTFRYASTYFDTPEWASYLGAARRRRHRFKVRTRSYLDSSACMLEIKVRDPRGHTVKHRHGYDLRDRHQLTAEAVRLVAGVPQAAAHARRLRPALEVTYHRSTLVLDGTTARVTIDRHPAWAAPEAPALALDGVALVETKTAGPPTGLDRLLWRAGHRPVAISKYCTGLALLRAELPANRWHRLLERDLRPTVRPASGAELAPA